jgi:hypothetical protein
LGFNVSRPRQPADPGLLLPGWGGTAKAILALAQAERLKAQGARRPALQAPRRVPPTNR